MVVVGFSETWVTPLLRRWWTVTLLGIALTAVGIVILLNPFDSVRVLAVLVAIGLALTAADEIAQAERHAVRWPSYVLAAIWLLTALVALLWPHVTLWALAVAVGVGLIVGGVAEFVFAIRFHRELPRWGLWWLDGLLAIGVGVVALVWPDVTLVALAVLLGLRIALRGLATISFGLGLRQLNRMTAPHVPT
jgi:uncharacterized membrane protein HdeD (DUF308 family)